MGTTFFVLALLQCALLFFLSRVGSRLDREERKPAPQRTHWPRTGLIVPAGGNHPRMREALESLLKQDYPALYPVIVTATADEPAAGIARELQARYPQLRHVVAGFAKGCGQKNHNSLKGVEAVEDEVELLAFCDSTHIAPRDFIRRLVAPVVDGEDFSTGYHKVVARDTGIVTMAYALCVQLMRYLQGISSFTQLWGGAMCFRLSAFRRYGVREFGMGAVMNGLKLHGGFIPYAGTFFVFSDYAKSIIRSAAIMKQRVIWVLTHDSIGVGEDGPTHQPVEQIAALRMTPGAQVWRPCDSTEAAVAWTQAVEYQDGPVCLVMSRQALPQQKRTEAQVADIRRGGYVLRDCEGEPELIYIATGSEVQLAVQAAEKLAAEGRRVRVVSMPSCEVFDRQDAAYRESVLPSSVRVRVAVEAQTAAWWWKYVGLDGRVVGMGTFGASAPAGKLFPKFGFTVENIVQQALELL